MRRCPRLRRRGPAGKRHGTPTRPEDLDDHRLILFGSYRPPVEDVNWLAEIGRKPGPPRRAVLEVNSLQGMLMAMKSGLGIAGYPTMRG